MLHFFTDPYKDELIYSAIARYHFYTGNIDFKDTLEELFGKRSIIPSLEIGSNFQMLAKNLGRHYTEGKILRENTIFTYYEPFLPLARKQEIVNDIYRGNGGSIYTRLGIVAGSICNKFDIYYCPLCANQEVTKYGEAYIHREHQLQGVFICPHHGVTLYKYIFDKSIVSRIEYVRLEQKQLCLEADNSNNEFKDKYLMISQSAYYLLNNDLSSISKEKVLDRYKNLLCERGLATSSKRIKQRELYEEFISYYGEKFLGTLESQLDNNNEYNWLRVITRNQSRDVHPLRHILLINFLCKDIKEFFQGITNNYNPFGNRPWPCLNIACSNYKKDVIEDVVVTDDYKTRVPVGTFRCNCGFIYSRKGPDKSLDDRYKIGRIKEFGDVWVNQLNTYINDNKYTLREIARLMNCDPKTVIKYKELQEKNNSHVKINNRNDLISKYKSDIITFIKENPNYTRTEVRKSKAKEYIYLYRYDQVWLYDALPQKKNVITHKGKIIDWNRRDDEILIKLRKSYSNMINRYKLVRVSISSIGKVSGTLSALEKNIDKLPKCKAYLDEITETVEQYQIRRCKKIVDDNKNINGKFLRLWEIQRIAGIRTKDFEIIKDIILSYINEIGDKRLYEKR